MSEREKSGLEGFGRLCFSDHTMRQRLSAETYRALHRSIEEGEALSAQVADEVAAP